jgi:hypothetical protein
MRTPFRGFVIRITDDDGVHRYLSGAGEFVREIAHAARYSEDEAEVEIARIIIRFPLLRMRESPRAIAADRAHE